MLFQVRFPGTWEMLEQVSLLQVYFLARLALRSLSNRRPLLSAASRSLWRHRAICAWEIPLNLTPNASAGWVLLQSDVHRYGQLFSVDTMSSCIKSNHSLTLTRDTRFSLFSSSSSPLFKSLNPFLPLRPRVLFDHACVVPMSSPSHPPTTTHPHSHLRA